MGFQDAAGARWFRRQIMKKWTVELSLKVRIHFLIHLRSEVKKDVLYKQEFYYHGKQNADSYNADVLHLIPLNTGVSN